MTEFTNKDYPLRYVASPFFNIQFEGWIRHMRSTETKLKHE